MIEIINEKGLILDLSDSFKLTIERNNPLFLKEYEFFQDITYPGKAPLTDNNKIFISLGHLIETTVYNYELPVSVFIDGTNFFSGNLAYSIQSGEISFVLKFGYAAVADLCDTTMMYEINYGENISVVYANKQDSITNPDSWPFAYFPSYHNTEKVEEYEELGQPVEYFSNPYNYIDQVKYQFTSVDPEPWRDISHFKLNYVLKIVLQSIGFEPTGSFFSSDYTKDFYIYNLQYAREIFTLDETTNAQYCVPHISITEFLKFLRDRFRVNITFDHLRKIATIEEPNSLLQSTSYIDISNYVSSVKAVDTSTRLIYKIEAKKADNDYNPPNHIEVVDVNAPYKLAEEGIEIPISTLPVVKHLTYDYYYPITHMPYLTGRPIGSTPLPPPRERRWLPPYNEARHSTLLLMNYPGLTLIEPGKYFPTAYPVEFNENDGNWFAFMNDSKVIKITASIPTHLLSQLDTNQKIGFISEENFFLVGIIEKVEYTLENNSKDLIETEFLVRALLEKKSKVELVANELMDEQQKPRTTNKNSGSRPSSYTGF